jgi:(p)ppGpp synthase/HD superfamily hydrolase
LKLHFVNESPDIADRALEFAIEQHANQTDNAGEAYIAHAMRVADCVGNDPTMRAVAYLHDVVEDTDTTIEDIRNIFGYAISEYVDKLTRRSAESYENYIERCSRSHRARVIKIADLVDNMNLHRLPTITLKDANRQLKYAKALVTLMNKECDG